MVSSGFSVLDSREVYIELTHGEFSWTDKETVEFYERKFQSLQRSGVTGRPAIRLIQLICDDFGELLKAESRAIR